MVINTFIHDEYIDITNSILGTPGKPFTYLPSKYINLEWTFNFNQSLILIIIILQVSHCQQQNVIYTLQQILTKFN